MIKTFIISTVVSAGVWGVASAQPAEDLEISADEPLEIDAAGDDEIVITGARLAQPLKDSPVAVEVMRREAIEQSGARDLAEALEEHPGVQVDRSFRGAGITLRGLDPKYVLILVDGQRVAGRTDGVVDLSRFPVSAIERVEIVKGPASALYGSDAMGGVINIITRDGGRGPALAAEATAQGDSRSQRLLRGSVSGRQGRLSGRISAQARQMEAYDLDPSSPDTDGSDFEQYTVSPQATWRSGGSTLTVEGAYLQQRRAGVDASATGAVLDRVNLTRSVSVAGRWRLRLDGGGAVSVNASHSRFRDQFERDQRGASALDTLEDARDHLTVVNGQWSATLGGWHLLSVGAEGLVEVMESPRLTVGDGRGDRARVSAWLQDVWTVLPDPYLTLVPGIRVDRDDQFGTAVSPKLALRVDPVEGLVARGSFGAGFRAPDFKELLLRFENPGVGYVVQGNPDLQPERSWTADGGLELDRGPLWLSGSAYYTEVDELIQTALVEEAGVGRLDQYGYVNVAHARIWGAEGRVIFRPASWLDVEGGYAFTDARDVTANQPLTNRSRHRVTGRLTGRLGAGSATLRCAYNSPRYQTPAQSGEGPLIRTPAFTTLDARVAWGEAEDPITAFVGGTNLLDQGEAVYAPLEPRTIYAGLTGRY